MSVREAGLGDRARTVSVSRRRERQVEGSRLGDVCVNQGVCERVVCRGLRGRSE